MDNPQLLFGTLPEITGGTLLATARNATPVEYLVLDSRKINTGKHTLFFAITGNRHDGHLFLNEAYQKGIRQFVVERNKNIDPDQFPGAGILETENTVQTLQQIAIYHRRQYHLPVFGITGSNGKTIVKEWLAQLLSHDHSVIKSPKSYNSQIGVPLSVWQINKHHNMGIFEAGISRPGEMENLHNIIQPCYGIITNIGTAHDESFESHHHKISEKLKLFDNCQLLFYCLDHQSIHDEVKKLTCNTYTWSRYDKQANITFEISKNETGKTYIKTAQDSFFIPFRDEASTENLLHCIAILHYFKVPSGEIQKRLNQLERVSMRLELKKGINGCYLIDDTYNNDLGGLRIALDYLKQQNQKAGKTVILSDLLEAGLNDKVVYQEVAELLEEYPVDRLIGIGQKLSQYQELFELPSFFYKHTDDFLQDINPQVFQDEVLLIKGARVFRFEKIIERFQQKVHGTVMEINLDALAHNLNYYRSKLKPNTKVMAMVKAFAYGSGHIEVANLLQFQRVDYLGVAYADEGVSLRQGGINLPVMVMNPAQETFEKLIQYDLEPDIYTISMLKQFSEFLHATGYNAKIHIELETGMNRLGIAENEIGKALDLLEANPLINLQSVFTHLAGADDNVFNDFSQQQYTRFINMVQTIEKKFTIPVKHILNSAGIVRFPEYQLDMVRPGIGLYGIETTGREQEYLQNVATLKSVISQIKTVKKGETIGYSRKGVATQDTRIGIIAIGYGDGYTRHFSNGVGKVLVNGHTAPVIGNICMDMTMINLNNIPATEGDEVILFGKELPITTLAESISTISYEILTNVSERVKRVFYSE